MIKALKLIVRVIIAIPFTLAIATFVLAGILLMLGE